MRRILPSAAMTTLCVATLLTSAGITPAGAQTLPDASGIVARGEAVVKRPADMAVVQIAVEVRASKPEDARRQAASQMSSVINSLRRIVSGDAINTSGFSLNPDIDYSNNRTQVRGYIARNQVEVRVENLDKLPDVLDTSVAGGATTIAGLRFDVKRRDQAEQDALRMAVEDAMARAQAMAAGAKRSLGPLIRLEEQRAFAQPMFRTMAMEGAADRGGSTPVVPGEIEIRAEVTATVAIR